MNGLRRRVRQWRRRGGDFAETATDDRAVEAARTWDAVWAPSHPFGPGLREDHPQRWLRVWSLPEGERIARDDDEARVVLRRHRSVLQTLNPARAPLALIAADWGPRDGAGGWTRRHLPGRRPWRSSVDPAEGTTTYFWIRDSVADDDLDRLLQLAVADVAQIVLVPSDMSWVYAPYDGGADVLAIDDSVRATLRDRHAAWLSTRADGL